MYVLGIETSCDETGVAIFNSQYGLLYNVLHSQIKIHNKFGGVVPEIASRYHLCKLLPLIIQVLYKIKLKKNEINAIAYTSGPGLINTLMIGALIANGLGRALSIPVIGVNHMEGHLFSTMLEDDPPEFPFVALLISGGHTELIDVKNIGKYNLLGKSLDDAVGEAFDKVAQMLGLNYPGGPSISNIAIKGNPKRFFFTRPMTKNKTELNFSFSGIKTCVLNTINKIKLIDLQTKADIAIAFEEAIVDTIIIKSIRSLKKTKYSRLVLAGGVSANIRLIQKLEKILIKYNTKFYYPKKKFCTDNGAMIAYAGAIRINYIKSYYKSYKIHLNPIWKIATINNL
ncbi:tRNA N6-adenosine threonylcarbamoyltransferase [Candidatus Johnevansia muelleri]|uniref:tRNA N6-adenosine threonylcarbamoyltransferase n=1 Tax=Candidatus Johnevansia muelleri TaxID=1495769 RepID=A0A078KEG6_9GAMM|nr:tRNA N6-adenosine threonylcarbamoyltransferase [Candidatus Evansia muelleri]